jgi:ClpP class serine protease
VSFYGRVISPGMDAFRASLAQAAANPDVAAIVLDVNSPGGTYAGTPETANAVRAAAAKPVIAVVDTLCASAAYFIASQAGEVVVTPSGEVGSIGVLAVHRTFEG